MAGAIDLIRKGQFRPDETVVFMDTGGTPAIFAQKEALLAFLKPGAQA